MTKPRDPRVLLVTGAAIPALIGLAAGLAPGLRADLLRYPVLMALLFSVCTGLPAGFLFLGFRDLWAESLHMRRLGYACFLLAGAPIFFIAGMALLPHPWALPVLLFAWTLFSAMSWPLYSRLHGLARVLPAFLCACMASGALCASSYGLMGYMDACRSRARECRGYARQEEYRIRRDTVRDPWLDQGLKTCGDPLYRLCLSGRPSL